MASKGNPAKRRRRPEMDDYFPGAPVPSQSTETPQVIQRHITYETTEHGISASRSYVKVPDFAARPPIAVTEPITWNTSDIPVDNDDNSFSFEWMEPGVPFFSPQVYSLDIQDNPLRLWEAQIDTYLHELLRLEGPADAPLCCAKCLDAQSLPVDPQQLYQCTDCSTGLLYCRDCMVRDHSVQPFHRVHEWNGFFFTKTCLKDLGLRLQLGHPVGQRCPNPATAADDNFVVLHTNGLHRVGINFCDCERPMPRHIQLLRARLFPATTIYPKTAATFTLLEHFQLLSFMSKVSAFEFYQTLVRHTDNTGTVTIPDRYAAFLRMVREWRHLKLLKRAGRGNDPAGVKGTQEGECAVLCPACPHPGINLPSGWEDAPAHQSWLYSLFIGIDANFRLKRLNVSSNTHDPGLNHGYAYFVEDTKFKAYLEEYGPRVPDDISTCSNHDAIKSASIRGGKGVDASGAGKAECARHDMKRPVSVGDLQKGERYVNMDYFFLSSLSQNTPKRVVVSYDIACQWARNLATRCHFYPPNPFQDQCLYLVPKFHLPAHQPPCHINFSFNFTPHVGRTDGEAPERGWAAINAVANSTKEMGPGSRRDTLDDHFGDYNWRKVITLASSLLRKLKEARSERSEHVAAFVHFDAALPEEDTVEWTRLVQLWESDGNNANPFAAKVQKITENAVRLELASEEEASLREDLTSAIHDDVSPSRLIAQGLELEDHQRLLRRDMKSLGPHATSLQRSKIIERGNRLWRKIEAWTSIQQLYMPGAAVLRSREEKQGGDEQISATNINLFLPSKIVTSAPCDSEFLTYEWRLRYAQAHASLHDIRRAILLRTQMYKTKDQIVRGQRMLTRSLALIATVQSRITAGAEKYREVRGALVTLAAKLFKTGWEHDLQVLTDDDLRGLMSAEGERSEGRHTLSWIWKVGTPAMEGEGKQEALRIEWCKSRARAHRWQEECLLLEEEMRRVILFFAHQEARWNHRAAESTLGIDSRTTSGMRAYALRQAALRRRMIAACEEAWKGISTEAPSGVDDYRVECH
ncbi:hypothetical protein FPV67DRAFT_1558069 [Lyophyllum atratum]|nr:hypothetical protein FPV67DRAFT_1558069 [Lyophyllum atratum]